MRGVWGRTAKSLELIQPTFSEQTAGIEGTRHRPDVARQAAERAKGDLASPGWGPD
jgi:hypothetical protein